MNNRQVFAGLASLCVSGGTLAATGIPGGRLLVAVAAAGTVCVGACSACLRVAELRRA